MKRHFAMTTSGDETQFRAQLAHDFPGAPYQRPQPYEVWVGVVPETKGVELTVIAVHDSTPVPYVECGSRQLGPGVARLVVFGRYFERREDLP